jgi:hypothetical protein
VERRDAITDLESELGKYRVGLQIVPRDIAIVGKFECASERTLDLLPVPIALLDGAEQGFIAGGGFADKLFGSLIENVLKGLGE